MNGKAGQSRVREGQWGCPRNGHKGLHREVSKGLQPEGTLVLIARGQCTWK